MRRFATACLLLLLTMLAACAAPAPEPAQAVAAHSDAAAPAAQPATSTPAVTPETAPPGDAKPARPKFPLRTGGPHPPERVGDRKPDPNMAPVQVDFSCKSDADCTVKNVGNCCGYYPACVNVDSPTDPEGVQRQCAKEGMVSVCGWAEISSCSCVQGRCQGNTSGAAVQ